MWKPKHPAFKNYAKQIAKTYKNYLKVVGNREAVKKTAEEYEISETQVYRYLKYLGVVLPNPNRKRNAKGQYTS